MKPLLLFLLAACAVGFSGQSLAQTSPARVEIADAAQPQLAVGSDGRVWLVFARVGEAPTAHTGGETHSGHRPSGRAGDVFVACSTDGGVSFAVPTKVAHVPRLMLGMRRGPRIAAHRDNLTVTFIGDELVAVTSTDGGKTWSSPVTINDVAGSAREGLHDLAGGPDGRLIAAWLDLRNGAMELWGAESEDRGRSWTTNTRIYRSPGKSICECCHPSALYDAEGNLAIMWRNSIDGARDMWMTTRAKGAAQFTAPQKLGEGTWKIEGCPMDGGRIVALGRGRFGAVWQRAGEVFLSHGGNSERKVGDGRQPVAVLSREGSPIVLWQKGADLLMCRLDGAEPVKRAKDGRFASVVALPDGDGAVLAYERGSPGALSITVERL